MRGQTYTVTETSYALFPRKEGLLEISPLFFSATLPGEQHVELRSEPLLLNSLPQAFTNTHNIWLPAKALYIEDNLNKNTTLPLGDELHRIISLEAEGLPASVLPALATLNNELAEARLLNVVLEEKMTDKGIVSTRMEEVSIRPTEQGEITLSAIDIPWWNTETETGQTATLKRKKLSVIAPVPVQTNANLQTAHPAETAEPANFLLWLFAALSLISTIGFIYVYQRLRRLQTERDPESRYASHDETRLNQQAATAIAEQNSFKTLVGACHQSSPELTQLRLIEWAQVFWNDAELHTLAHVCEKADNQTFNFLILDLEQHLHNREPWQGDLLLESVEKIRLRKQRQRLDLHEGNDHFSYTT